MKVRVFPGEPFFYLCNNNVKFIGLTNFHKRKNQNSFRCIKCASEAVAHRRRKIKIMAIEYKGGQCCRCEYNKCVWALEFHHTDPNEKDFSLSHDGHTRGWETIKAELDKCILVCSNCHSEIHEELLYNENSRLKQEAEDLRKLTKEELFKPKIGPTFCIDCNIEISHNCKRCLRCEAIRKESLTKIEWPSKETLQILVWQKPLIQIGKELGVSDNAVKKRCKKLNIQRPQNGYWMKKGSIS